MRSGAVTCASDLRNNISLFHTHTCLNQSFTAMAVKGIAIISVVNYYLNAVSVVFVACRNNHAAVGSSYGITGICADVNSFVEPSPSLPVTGCNNTCHRSYKFAGCFAVSELLRADSFNLNYRLLYNGFAYNITSYSHAVNLGGYTANFLFTRNAGLFDADHSLIKRRIINLLCFVRNFLQNACVEIRLYRKPFFRAINDNFRTGFEIIFRKGCIPVNKLLF